MTIDRMKALRAEIPASKGEWDNSDVILYHLGIGAGVPPTSRRELGYVYEKQLKVLPTFAVIPALRSMVGLNEIDGFDIDPAMLLHGEHELEVLGPVPTSATVSNAAHIEGVFDKGKGALVVVRIETTASDGKILFINRLSLYVRGEGGFGGQSGSGQRVEPPDRACDSVIEIKTLPQQALIYRLSGDLNPLHVDPDFAMQAGFDAPILHGMCTYGMVCKAVVDELFDGDVGGVRRFHARFAGVVFPGETIRVSLWHERGRAIIEAVVKERRAPAMTNAAIELW